MTKKGEIYTGGPFFHHVYKVFKESYSSHSPWFRCVLGRSIKVCGRRCHFRSFAIYITLIFFLLFIALWFKIQLNELRFAPKQLLGYRYCDSLINKEKLHKFDSEFPCNFKIPPPDENGALVVTFVNSGWINLTKNWICSAKKVGLINNILLITVEANVCSYFPDVPCHYEKGSAISGTNFGQPNYQKFMIERTKITLRLLSCKIEKLLLSDADVVFLKNPIIPLEKELGTQDIVFQRDSTGIQMVDSLSYNLFHYICGGFIYMKVNNKTKLLYQSLVQFQRNQSWNDQAGLNICIRHHSLGMKWSLLPVPLFPNGKAFFEFGADPEHAVIVHANFKSGSIDKIVNMILHDIWCQKEMILQLCKHYLADGCINVDNAEDKKPWCQDFQNLCVREFLNA